jgi:site-specific DNA-methyltransferase (cytosine-N4-specific)
VWLPIATKTVKGIRYLYFTYYDNDTKKKVELYCGPESDPQSLKIAKQHEREYLKSQVRSFQRRLDELAIEAENGSNGQDVATGSGQVLRTIPKGYEKKDSERVSLEREFNPLIREEPKLSRYVSYVGNRDVPFLRLYRYKEAFGFDFARFFIKRFRLNTEDYLFDPFMGMGSSLFAAMLEEVPSIGIDKLPIAAFVAQTIPLFLRVERGQMNEKFGMLKESIEKSHECGIAEDVPIIKVAFPPSNLKRLRKWKTAIEALDSPFRELFRLLFFSILEETSYTSKDGQFLRLIEDKKVSSPDEALARRVEMAEEDIRRIGWFFSNLNGATADIIPQAKEGDALNLSNVHFNKAPSAIITSPPYLNRYDYTRTYVLELCFHFVNSQEELKVVRQSILRSHIESVVRKEEKPQHPAVKEVIERLTLKREELNNPKIPDMIVGYFNDMEKAIKEWHGVLAKNARVAMVVDNVRFEGEVIPVDLILTDMARTIGFKAEQILVSRYKGNSSQQMGKYGRVPMRESVVVWSKP